MQVIDLGAWTPYLEQELRAPYFAALLQRVGAARAAGTVYPPEERTFFALTATPPERVRAVILGQDPYHEPGQAMGLAFSVPQGERLPPSLRNIFTELHTDLGLPQPFGGIGQAVCRGGHADRPERQRRERRGERDARDAAQPGFPWYLLHDRHLGTNLCDRRDGYSRQKYFGKAREGLDFALFFCIIVELMVSP